VKGYPALSESEKPRCARIGSSLSDFHFDTFMREYHFFHGGFAGFGIEGWA
jgi:hypothetical protein